MMGADLPPLLQRFFTGQLMEGLGASPHTVAGYRDTFRLLLRFATDRLGCSASQIQIAQLDIDFLLVFLNHLESQRGNSIRTRNTRLAALHAFFRYVAINEPGLALHCQRVLAIPVKRFDRSTVEFLTEEEAAALIAAPDCSAWIGRRDHALLTMALQTGLRNSEITALRRSDVTLGTGAHVSCLGKGRKARRTPLRPDVAALLGAWLEDPPGEPSAPLFPSSRNGGHLSADALQRLVGRHVATAGRTRPTLRDKVVTPHTLRHTAAMCLLTRGVNITVIALWLGHESPETTKIYVHADMRLKEQALGRATDSGVVPKRYKPPDPLLAFLESL